MPRPVNRYRQPDSQAPMPKQHQPPTPKNGWLTEHWKLAIGVAIAIAVTGVLAYGYVTTKDQLTSLKNGNSAKHSAQTEAGQITAKVGQYVDLPTGETPTLATVNDVSKLKKQAFFDQAQNGDKVLIYAKAGKAVLYRPSTNKVILYSSINLGGNPSK